MNSKTAHIWSGNRFNIGDHVLCRKGNIEFEISAIHIYPNAIQYDIVVAKTVIRHINEDELREC